MAKLLTIPTFTDSRGSLSVTQDVVPFDIKRVYYIFDAIGIRGGHRHKKTIQALMCPKGKCKIFVHDGYEKVDFWLDEPNKMLIVESRDWHTMSEFSSDCVLLVFASEKYDKEDYIDEPYDD